MTQLEILLGLALGLTLSASYLLLRGVLGMKRNQGNPRHAKAIGRRMLLTTLAFLAVPVLMLLGQRNWGDMTSLYAFLAGLVTVNAIWFRDIR